MKNLYLNESIANFISGTRYELGTIEFEYRPINQIEKWIIMAASGSTTLTARLIISTSGTVYFTPYADRPSGSNINISETYI